jgi:K+-sensing histidine kinase KdpD
LLKTVLRNLLDNAIKYATPGSPVGVSLASDGPRAVIRIGNDCPRPPGLPASELVRGYTRGANSPGKPGLGMGLHLAQRLAADMGGELIVDTARAGRFEVTLALRQGPLRNPP